MLEEIEIQLHLQELERQIVSFRVRQDAPVQGSPQATRPNTAGPSFWRMGTFFAPSVAARRIPRLEELLR